jgi:hypothetical protein
VLWGYTTNVIPVGSNGNGGGGGLLLLSLLGLSRAGAVVASFWRCNSGGGGNKSGGCDQTRRRENGEDKPVHAREAKNCRVLACMVDKRIHAAPARRAAASKPTRVHITSTKNPFVCKRTNG